MALGRAGSGRTSFVVDNDILVCSKIIPGRYDEGAAISVSLGTPRLFAMTYVDLCQYGASGIEIASAQG
jgi:hypothetical protein